MNRKQKQALADAFRAPPPVRKAAFLKQYRRRELGRGELIFIAAGTIPWWVWALSLLLGALMLAAAAWAATPVGLGTVWSGPAGPEPGMWYAAAFTPFLALLAITENGRAQFYRMEELELACRISRRSTVLARMAVLGLFHLLLLGALAPSLAVRDAVSVAGTAGAAGMLGAAGAAGATGIAEAVNAAGAVSAASAAGAADTAGALGVTGAINAAGALRAAQAGMYLLVPYLLTAALGMELARRFHGREGLLACAAAAVLVCGLGAAAPRLRPALYQQESIPLWTAALAVAFGLTAAEFCFHFKAMGELQ